MIKHFDLFTASLQHNCLYCIYGDVVLDDNDDLVGDHLACMAHSAEDVKSKKFTGVPRPNREFKRTFCPIMNWDETCASFKPLKVGGRKFKTLDKCGLFKCWNGSCEDDKENM